MSEKTFSVHIEMDVDLTQQDIDDIMCSALEGGINYWCGRAEVVEEKRCSDWGHEQIARGGALILHDSESPDKWELNLEKFLKGVALYFKAGNGVLVEDGKLDLCDLDASDADMIVQYALFGELVFG